MVLERVRSGAIIPILNKSFTVFPVLRDIKTFLFPDREIESSGWLRSDDHMTMLAGKSQQVTVSSHGESVSSTSCETCDNTTSNVDIIGSNTWTPWRLQHVTNVSKSDAVIETRLLISGSQVRALLDSPV